MPMRHARQVTRKTQWLRRKHKRCRSAAVNVNMKSRYGAGAGGVYGCENSDRSRRSRKPRKYVAGGIRSVMFYEMQRFAGAVREELSTRNSGGANGNHAEGELLQNANGG